MNKTQDKPDSLTLASYLDGRLDAAESKAVERWLADSPEGIDLLNSVSQTLSTPSPMAPDSLVRSASALIPDPDEKPAVLSPVFAPVLAPVLEPVLGPALGRGRFWHFFYWPSTAALVLVSCLVGFQLAQSAMTEAGLVEPPAFEIRSTAGLFDPSGSPL